jgi:copper resistance protein B
MAQETVHVSPDPPKLDMPTMSDADMRRVMQMDDAARFVMFKLDEFERAKSGAVYSTVFNAQAWYGGDVDKFWLRTEGTREESATDARVEAFWDHAFASYWDWQLGARRDFGTAPGRDVPGRSWAAFGVQGLAPYGLEIEATAYLGEQGRSAARFRAEYELLLSQRLILTPELELNIYARNDRARAIASGVSNAEFGLRLRYEIRREFAPYLGIVWKQRRAASDDLFRAPDQTGTDCQFVIGLRLWL